MKDKENKGLDLLGIYPIAEAINKGTDTCFDILNKVCSPAAEELGYLFQDKVRSWRVKNISKIFKHAENILNKRKETKNLHAHPKVVLRIIESGTLVDSDKVQQMWAGLLASSCTEEENDEGNLIFINILSQLTTSQVCILKFACENAEKVLTDNDLIYAHKFMIAEKDLIKVSKIKDIHQLDRELDYLRSLDLIVGGFYSYSKSRDADITPTPLALNLYVRCQGSLKNPVDYFSLSQKSLQKN